MESQTSDFVETLMAIKAAQRKPPVAKRRALPPPAVLPREAPIKGHPSSVRGDVILLKQAEQLYGDIGPEDLLPGVEVAPPADEPAEDADGTARPGSKKEKRKGARPVPTAPQRVAHPFRGPSPAHKDVPLPAEDLAGFVEEEEQREGESTSNSHRVTPSPAPQIPITIRNSLRDQHVLALASLRAGHTANEAKAHFSRGVLYDNEGQYTKAILCYKRYLAACHRAGDVLGETLAYNHMGVDYQVLGGENLQLAIVCHKKHADIADGSGKFIAHHNLGLTYAAMGQDDFAAHHYQQALEYARQLQDAAGEALASGQLGAALGRLNDTQQANDFMQRRVDLAESMGDVNEKAVAYRQLGDLAAQQNDVENACTYYEWAADLAVSVDKVAAATSYCDLGQYANDNHEYDRAIAYFEEGLGLASEVIDPALINRAKCGVGIARGNQKMLRYLASVCKTMGSTRLKEHLDDGTLDLTDDVDTATWYP